MKTLITIATLLTLAGCATTYEAAPQTTRAKGETEALNITGKLSHEGKISGNDVNIVTINFNGKQQITVKLDKLATGEATGEPYNGKSTSASCTSKQTSRDNVAVNCMVFIDNERSVTLTF